MRQRIVLATVAVLAAALLAFAVPLGIAVRGVLESRALDELQAQTEQVGVLIDAQARTCGAIDLILTIASRERAADLALFTPSGRLVATVGGHRPTSGRELAVARTGATGRAHRAGQLAVAVPLTTDVCRQALVLHAEQPDDALVASVRRSWATLVVVGLAVLGLAGAAAGVTATRLTRPLDDLADGARRLGDGDFSARVPRSGLGEIDAIADTLDRTAARLGRAVERSRAFAADASHQLRTPLTALRLHLEALADRGDDGTARAALAEADRLEATILELVALTDLDASEEACAPIDLVRGPVEAAAPVADGAGRALQVDEVPCPPVRVRPAAIRQAVQVLLDNALQHGRGTVTVSVAPTLPDAAVTGARICVADEGPGLPAEVIATLRERDRGPGPLPLRGGRGLALARVLVEGEGGRLVVPDGERARVCLVLPAADTDRT